MRDEVPWRGPREKHQSFYQMLIEAFTKEGNIVMDWHASTGNSFFSIVAVQSSFKHPPYRGQCFYVLLISLNFTARRDDLCVPL